MGWLLCLLLISSIALISGQDAGITLADFEAELQEESLKVLRMHMDEMSRIPQPPSFDMPQNFMRSYIPSTGVGNREDLVIESIKQIPVFHETNHYQWHYKRFNNTDYILGVNERNVVLNKFNSSEQEFFSFAVDDAVFSFVTDPWSIVRDVAIFTRTIKRSIALYVAILTEGPRTSTISLYEVIGGRGLPVSLIDLGITAATGPLSAKKIAFVKSQFGESLVVLINSPYEAKVIPQHKGSSELNHYIEVYYPSAVDLVTFTVLGHGYLAVANSATCEIFKLDKHVQSNRWFDKITPPRTDIVDLEYFRLGFHHYLAVSGRNEQYLYVWKSGEFSLTQSFNGLDAGQLYSSVLPTCRDDVILFLVSDATVGIYVYDGKNNKFVRSNAVIPPTFRISPGSVTSFTHKNKVELVFQSHGSLEAFVISTSLKSARNPFQEAGENVADYMKKIQEMLENQYDQVQNINSVLRNAVRTNGDQHITSYQTFDDLRSNTEAVVNLEQTVFVEWDSSSLTLEQYKIGTESLESRVAELEKLIEGIRKVIPDVVRIDEDAEITGTKTFMGDVTGSSILAHGVNLQTAAGIDVPQLQNEIYRLDKPQQIKGTLTFQQPLTVNGNLDVEQTINGIDISRDVMTTNTKQVSYANMNFANKVVIQGDLSISGKLNNIDISEEVVTLGGQHNIVGKKSFQNGIVTGHVETKLLDGLDIKDVYNRALTKSSDQEVTGTKTFSGGLITNNIILHGFLNGYNITELAENIVRVDRPAVITGHKTFLDDVHLQSTLTVEGRVNGLKIPDDLFLADVSQRVTGEKIFTGTVTAYDVTVEGTVDDLDIPGDVVTLTGDEEVPGTLYFTEGIDVQNDMIVHGLVDGVHIAEIARQALKLNESSTFIDAVFHGPVTITDNLVVAGTVNGIKLDDIVKNIIFKDDKDVVIESEKRFRKVTANTVNLERMINGYNITVDFMKVRGDQVISGTKIFKQPVTFKSLNTRDGMIGTLNVTQLFEHRLTLEIEDEVDGDAEFADHVIVEGNLIVHGTVGGLKIPDDIVLKNAQTPIANKVFTNKVKVGNLIVNGNALVSGSFGGIDLNEFYRNRVSLSTDQEIEGDVWIGNSSVETMTLYGGINGIDIGDFANNVMSKTKNQDVLASKIFTGETIVEGPISTEEGINGVNLAEVNNRAFKLHGGNLLTVPFDFGDISVNDISVTGSINGINLTYVAEDSLKKSGYQLVSGVNSFEAGFQVDGDIGASTVNDLFLPRDILLKSIPQTISGQFTIQTLDVAGDVHVGGLVNGLDLSEIALQIARSDQETVIESDVTFLEPIYVSEDVQVTGSVNGIDLKRISENILLKEGDQRITGSKVLRGNVTIRGDIDVEYVNGLDWKAFLADVVRIDTPQNIPSPKTFTTDVEMKNSYVGEVNVGLVNGKILEDFFNDVVFIDEPAIINGRKEFIQAVEIAGNLDAELINGLKLKTDVITLMCSDNGPQLITGEKTFHKMSVYGDMHVPGKVNSLNLFDLYTDTLFIDGDQTVPGMKTFNDVAFLGNVYPETVNDMKLNTDLVTLNTDQDIQGNMVFNNDINIEKNLWVHGLINGINLTELAQEAVYLDAEQTIEGPYVFKTVSSKSDVVVDGLVNGVDLPAFEQNVDNFWQEVTQSLHVMDLHSKDGCELAKYLQDVLSKSYYILDGFVMLQEFSYPASFLHVRSEQEIALVRIDDPTVSATAVFQTWNTTTKAFSTTDELSTYIAKTLITRIGSFEVTVSVGIHDKDSFVSADGPILTIPGGFKEAAILTRKLEEQAIIALLFPSKGIAEVYKISLDSTLDLAVESYGTVTVGKDSASIEIFEIEHTINLAVSRHCESKPGGFSKIYTRGNEGWRLFQNIAVSASSYVKHFFYHGYHYLVFANNAPLHETREPKSIQIYRNSPSNQQWFNLFQKIHFDDGRGLEIFQFGDLNELHLATWNETRIQIFRLEGESGLRSSTIIHGHYMKDLKVLQIDGDVYLAVGRQNLRCDQPVSSVLYKGLTKGTKYFPRDFTYC